MRVGLALTAALATLLALPVAAAQGQQAYGVDVTATETEARVEPEGSVTFTVTVRNTGSSPVPPGGHRVVIDVAVSDTVRFYAAPDAANFTLAPGATRDVVIRVDSLTRARDTSATIDVTATVTDPPAQLRPTDTQRLTVEQEGNLLTPLTSFLGDKAIWVIIGGIGVLVVILIAATNKKKGGVRLRCAEPNKTAEPGAGVTFPVVVENTGRDDDVISLSLSQLPEGWENYLSKGEVSLEAGDEETIFLTVKAPGHASPGARVTVRVLAESGASPRATDSLETVTTVAGPPAAPPPSEPEEPDPSVLSAVEPPPEPPKKTKKAGQAEAPPGPTKTVRRRKAYVEEDEPTSAASPEAAGARASASALSASPVIEVGDGPARAEPPAPEPTPPPEPPLVAVKRRKAASA